MKEAAILEQYNERVDSLQAQLFAYCILHIAYKAINNEWFANNHAPLITLLESVSVSSSCKSSPYSPNARCYY